MNTKLRNFLAEVISRSRLATRPNTPASIPNEDATDASSVKPVVKSSPLAPRPTRPYKPKPEPTHWRSSNM